MATYEDGYDPKLGYNLNAFAHPTLPLKAIGTVVKLIVNPLGLASEAIYNYEDGKRAAGSSTSPESPSGDRPPFASEEANVAVMDGQAEELTAGGRDNSAVGHACVPELLPECEHREVETGVVDNDEVDWALDDAALGTGDPPPQNTVEQFTIEQLDEAPFGRGLDNGQHPENPRGTLNHMNKLPYPVVLPQRRPGTKARGFVRAYAPVLQDTGIEQEMFLQFLKSLHNATQASPVFKCIMVGTAIAGAVPDLSVALAMQALQIAAGICQEMQQRWRMNRFLIQANKELFMPRGLLALVVTYKMGEDDGAGIVTATVDIGATAFVKYGDELSTDNVDGDPESSSAIQKRLQRLKEKSKRLRVASAATHVWEMPADCASLIYPDLDRIQDEEVGGDEARQSKTLKNIKSKSRSTSKFVNDYFDWRARATFAAKNPGSKLNGQAPPTSFKSRLADPNNHTNKHFFTLISGGRFKAEPLGAKRRWERAKRQTEERRIQGIKETPKRRLIQEGVLYLMIVNMPSESELAKAKEHIESQKQRKAQEQQN